MKNTDEATNIVYKTTDYSKFKLLVGNRRITEDRKLKIRNSIKKIGYIPCPIICNEKMGVIDGQGRLAVCKEDGLPIYYIIVPGIGVEECINMNINQKNWTNYDYITSYADLGDINYVRLLSFLDNNPKYNFSIKIWAVFWSDLSNKQEKLKSGNIVITEKMIEEAQELLNFFNRFSGTKTNRIKEFLTAIGYCYKFPEVDNERLVKKVNGSNRYDSISDTDSALEHIELEYNKNGKKGEHVYIKTLYYQYLESRGIAQACLNNKVGRGYK